jgi:hypothetical protein
MDIQALSMNMSQGRLMDEVGTAMLGKSLKAAKDQGAEVVQLIQSAPSPGVLGPGQGTLIDFYA